MVASPVVVVQGAAGPAEVPDLSRLEGRAQLRFAPDAGALRHALPGAEVLLGWNFASRDLRAAWPQASTLRWIHWCGAGVDAALFPALRDADVLVTNARGVFDAAMAEYALALILAFAKQLPETLALQREGIWRHRLTEMLAGRQALIIGVGSIGRAIARSLTAAGMRVTGVGRRARVRDADFLAVHAVAELDAHLADADYVVLIAPLTDATRGLMNAARLRALKPTARLLNLGRGALLDQAAVAEALATRRIAGAALDVFDVEPLPADSPLWTLDNVIISPHMSGDFHGHYAQLAAQFYANFERYVAGQGLTNVVDKQLGFVAD